MGIIDLRADLTRTSLQLERIANALERILLEEYGVQMKQPTRAERRGEADVLYTRDEDTVRDEILTDVGRLPRNPEMGDEKDDDKEPDGIVDEEVVGEQSASQRPLPTNVSLP